MPNYSVKCTVHLSIEADTEQEALENFWSSMREVFDDSDISDVVVLEGKDRAG
jgi:hypothetical protein